MPSTRETRVVPPGAGTEPAQEPAQEPTQEQPRSCPRCSTQNAAAHNFCSFCGHNLSGAVPAYQVRDPLIGAVVGERYRLLTKIGTGGMGTVYKVEHVQMGKLMAIKLLHGDLSRDESMIRRFNREARAVSRLTNPHTVQVFDYGQSDGLVYLVMEYLRGRDLGRLISEVGALELDRCVDIAQQIAMALREAHDCGVVHRDLKPENIFICAPRAGRELIKVLDFGLARFTGREEFNRQTLQGSIIGTPYYMSPEQIRNEEVSPRSDIYSLGALLFKLLTGEPPYTASSPLVVLSAHLRHEIPSAAERVAERWPERVQRLKAVDPVLRKALAKDPAERYPTVTALAQALAQAAAQPEDAPVPQPPLQRSSLLAPEDMEGPSSSMLSTRRDWERYERRFKLRRQIPRVVAIVAMVALLAVAWWGLVQGNLLHKSQEEEPNEQPAQATTLHTGRSIQGVIGLPMAGGRADQDVYALRHGGAPGDLLHAELSAVPGLDLVLEAFDGGGELVARANSGGVGQGEWLRDLQWTGGPLYLTVREVWIEGIPPRSAPQSPYTLRVVSSPADPGQEREPNQTVAQAAPLRSGDVVRGYLSSAEDRDLYALPPLPPAGAVVTVSLRGAAGAPMKVEVVGGGGVKLKTWRLDGRGQLRLFMAPVGRQPMHLGVVAGASPEGWSGGQEPYTLALELAPLGELVRPPARLLQDGGE